jgi:hypothetical protein
MTRAWGTSKKPAPRKPVGRKQRAGGQRYEGKVKGAGPAKTTGTQTARWKPAVRKSSPANSIGARVEAASA